MVWVRTGADSGRPLVELWNQRVARLEAVAKPYSEERAALLLMMSNENLQQLDDAIARAERNRAPPPDDPAVRAVKGEIWQLIRAFNTAASEIKEARFWLDRARVDWRHRLLKDVSADCFTSVELMRDARGETPSYDGTVSELREIAKQLFERVSWIKAVAAQISQAQAIEKWPKDEQAYFYCEALAKENVALKSRLAAIEAAIGALQIKRNPPKRKKSKTRKARPQSIQQEAHS